MSSHYDQLKSSWAKKHRKFQKNLWKNHGEHLEKMQAVPRQLAAGSLAGMIMLAQPAPATLLANAVDSNSGQTPVEKTPEEKKAEFIASLQGVLPDTVQPLTPEQETTISQILSQNFGMNVAAELEGKRLNRTYGLIGAEQHLVRYPGDTMATHFSNQADAQKYYSSGMAPGRGAYGYFAQSPSGLTQKEIDREKYYIAVQTFLAPGWNDDVNGHYKFFRFRKMLVVNPENGKAIVADIGDAGPAKFTGKSLGGSPEVMIHLERVDGRAKGPVLYFFIDDPGDTIPLGPIDIS